MKIVEKPEVWVTAFMTSAGCHGQPNAVKVVLEKTIIIWTDHKYNNNNNNNILRAGSQSAIADPASLRLPEPFFSEAIIWAPGAHLNLILASSPTTTVL